MSKVIEVKGLSPYNMRAYSPRGLITNPNRLLIYDYGKEFVPIVEGYKTGVLSKQATYLHIEGAYTKSAYYVTDVPVDLTHINSIFFTGKGPGGTDNAQYRKFGVASNKTDVTFVAWTQTQNQIVGLDNHIQGIFEADVSALSGEYYVKCGIYVGSGSTGYLYVYQIWGE